MEYIKFDKPILLPVVGWVAGCTRLEPGGEVCAGVSTLVLIRKQVVFEAMESLLENVVDICLWRAD